jgi:ubiquitin carboxyl-terminal hydrolase 22/27/51
LLYISRYKPVHLTLCWIAANPFQRFEHTKAQSSKIETRVSFPLRLDVNPYTTPYQQILKKSAKTGNSPPRNYNTNTPANSVVYELSCVIVHKGKIDSGHYVNYAREGNDWFLFDDSKVVLASEAEVLAAEAYLLFYMVGGLEV